METNNGKYLEYLVQLIERSISPDSIVEHDVELPILNSIHGNTTQCDIVIRTGKKPRETITIVEVQDRTSKVKPNDFRGWQQKLVEVGAQHLICVSRQEFPDSIKEKASSSGNTIRLITLKELSAEQIPLNFFKHKFIYRSFDITTIFPIKLNIPKSDSGNGHKLPICFLNPNKKIFSIDKIQSISIYHLCREAFKPRKEQMKGRSKLKFDYKKNPIYYFHEGNFVKTGLDLEFDWIQEVIEIPTSTISYEQNNFGALAWVLEATYQSPKGLISCKIPVTYDGESYQIRNMVVNVPENSEIVININKDGLEEQEKYVS